MNTNTVTLYGSLGRYFDSMSFRTATMYDGIAAEYIESHCIDKHWSYANRVHIVTMPSDWFTQYENESIREHTQA